MIKVHIFFCIIFAILGLIFSIKKIKSARLFNISIINILIVIYFLVILIMKYIVPLPSYYIKSENIMIGRIIESEMTNSNIQHDEYSTKIIGHFLGKYNRLYLFKYENNGVEEARMFDFKSDIFGNLKPASDFKNSHNILIEDTDDYNNSRFIKEGLSTFRIRYGYDTDPIIKNTRMENFKVPSLHPGGYYLNVEMYKDSNISSFIFILALVFIVYREYKSDVGERTVIIKGKNKDILSVEYHNGQSNHI